MITKEKLQALKFHKIVWNDTMPDYWLPLLEPTGDQLRDMDHRLGVRFNECKDEPGPMVYLIVRGMMRLPHVKEMSQLIQLYELLAGHSFMAENIAECPLCGGTVNKFECDQECFHCGTLWTPGGARYPHGYRPEWRGG